ncbi:F0F1 ATP synthase subunit B' [Telmatospirillum siberiense]|uniref:ATP synthase subunit b n=1 Tax=Telmatospirillum siberiense TaxID=382514 RepID=A0A2N3PTN5_9PROT|nr:F0F1 ATP synthase subunit B' [Telmatospirillum siberiense]PKU23759.1 F0F1 ATP synthase subunit B' [Telmatospirillum siberiense]
MPQFDPTFFSTQLFWLFVTFTLLYVLMSTLAMPKIGAVLEERQRKIDDNLDKAAQLKAEAETAIALYEKALAESRAQAQAILRSAGDEMTKQAEERQKLLGERLAQQVKAGEARINAAKEQALTHVRDIATEAAKTAAAKLTGVTHEDATVAQAVAAALEEGH